MIRTLLIAALLATPAVAFAQDKNKDQPPEVKRVRNILLFGDDKCPTSTDPNEIVVCSNAGDSQYRIPEKLREHDVPMQNQSWTRRAEVVQDVNRNNTPDSCSTTGMAGQGGCTKQMIQNWAEEQHDKQAAEQAVP